MARARDPNRDKAFEIYKEHEGNIPLKDIAAELGKGEGTVRGWKNKDDWDGQLNGTLQSDKRNAPTKNMERSNVKEKEQSASSSAKPERRRSGNPNPVKKFTERNTAAVKHGLFSRYIPQETLELMGMLDDKSPADLIWDQIQIQYAAIIRSQSIMFVTDKNEMIKEIKKQKFELMEDGPEMTEIEYDFQFAWERQAQFLNAQSRAIGELRTSIKQFITLADEEDERRLKLVQMQLAADKTKAEIERLQKMNETGNQETTEEKLADYFTHLREAFTNADSE